MGRPADLPLETLLCVQAPMVRPSRVLPLSMLLEADYWAIV